MLLRPCLTCRIPKKTFLDIEWKNLGRRSLSISSRSNRSTQRLVANFRCVSSKNNLLICRPLATTTARLYSLPPHTVLPLPALSPTMQTGTIARWEIKEGDSFEVGDLIAEIETDKATLGFEAADDGVLAKVLVPSGTKNIAIGTPVAIIVEDESHVSKFANYNADEASSSTAEVTESPPPSAAAPPAASPSLSYPEHIRVDLPALSPTMTSGSLVAWEIKVGDKIEEGDSIATIETDKASVALEIQDEGYLAKILVDAGTKDLDLGTPLCVIVENKEDVPAFADYTVGAASTTAAAAPVSEATSEVQGVAPPVPAPTLSAPLEQAAAAPQGGRVFASPLARKLAAERNLVIEQFAGLGSGPDGRIVAKDLNKQPVQVGAPAAAAAVAPQQQPTTAHTPPPPSPSLPPATPPAHVTTPAHDHHRYDDIDVTNVRKVIASRLLESKQTIPHYYLTADVEMDEVLRVRKDFNNKLASSGEGKLSVNDFIIKASALACMKVPETNSQWNDTFIRQFKTCDMSIAVSTDNGLITPIVFDAQGKGLSSIATEVKDLAARARDGKLKPEEFMGGTFTISNLGMFGVEHFSAVINPPQSCILAVGSARRELVPGDEDDKVRVATRMSVTLSCDHRVVDGAVGAQWLQHFKKLMENPINMLL